MLFSFGLGFSGIALARAEIAEGGRVAGTMRDPDGEAARAAQIRAMGVAIHRFPLADPRVLDAARAVVSFAPPSEAGDPILLAHGADLAARADHIDWIGYLSTTAVYGDHGGGWVDEESPRAPASPRGRLRAAAEVAWLELGRRAGIPVCVFRLPGIYGPGRSAFDQLRSGRARRILKPGQVFSRIHVDDLATALRLSMARPRAGAIYNLCDNEPAPASDVVAHAAMLLGVEAPPEIPFDEADMTPMARSFYSESKRVSNALIKRELGFRPAFPTYREGLAAVLDAEAVRR